MKRIARAATVAGLTIGVGLLAVPAASAHSGPDITIVQVHSVSEDGPGDLNFNQVVNSPHASPKVGNTSR